MKIEVGEGNTLLLKEVYGGVAFETAEGNKLSVCMRDDTFEINMFNDKGGEVSNWHRLDFGDMTISKIQ